MNFLSRSQLRVVVGVSTYAGVLLSSALAANPVFDDPRGRFSVELPAGWEFAPQAGDVSGASFRRHIEGIPGAFAIRVFDLQPSARLAELMRNVSAASEQEPGFRLILDEETVISGEPARKRRFTLYIGGDPKWSKMVEQRMVVVHGRGYVLHAETVAEAFGTFADELERLFASFRPWISPSVEKLAKPTLPDATRLVGRWAGGGHRLHLSPSGVVLFGERHGQYRVKDGALLLQLGDEHVVVRYEFKGEALRLTDGPFGAMGTLLQREAP